MAAIAPDFDGAPVLLLSTLAVHTANLAADNRVSLLLDARTDDDGSADPMTRPRVSLGIMPGYGSSTDGLVVDSVVPNRAAQKAGLKDGDTIIQIGDTQVKDIYGYMEALRERKPGDEVKVVVMRDGKKLEFKLTLDESPSARGRE